MYVVRDDQGRETRCDTLAEAEVVTDAWYKAGSGHVEYFPVWERKTLDTRCRK
jgi:hypothetical protein